MHSLMHSHLCTRPYTQSCTRPYTQSYTQSYTRPYCATDQVTYATAVKRCATTGHVCPAIKKLSLDWPLTRFGFFGSCCTSSFCVFRPVLSSPAHGAASLDMALRRIEVVFVLWDGLKLTSGLRTSTAFNGQNYFSK
jgi:hypothetical protein